MNNKDLEKRKRFSENIAPLSAKGWPKWAVYLLSILGFVYLLNPTAGIIELLPDSIPLFGNLDEGAAALALWYGYLELKKSRQQR